MADYGNPYPVRNPIGAGLAAAQQVIGLRKALHEGDQQRQLTGLQLKQTQLGIDKAQRENDSAKEVADLRRGYYTGLAGFNPQAKAADSSTLGVQPSDAKPGTNGAQAGNESNDSVPDLARQYHAGVNRLDVAGKPEVFDSLADFATGLQNGDSKMVQQSWPGVLDAYNQLHRGDILKGVGEKLPSGETITDKQVVDFHGMKDRPGYIPVLSVTAQAPDGTQRTYQAPATEGRNGNPRAPVMIKSEDDLLGEVHNALEASLLVQDPPKVGLVGMRDGYRPQTVRRQWDDMYRQKFAAAGLSRKEIDDVMGAPQPVGDAFWARDEATGKPGRVQMYSDGSRKVIDGLSPYEQPKYGTTAIKNGGYELTYNTENGRPTGDPIARSALKQEGAETFGAPVDELDENGNPIRAQYGNHTTRHVVQGSRPMPKANGSVTIGPDGSVQVTASKPMGAALQKAEDNDIESLNLAAGMRTDLQSFMGQIQSGDLQLGPMANLESKVRNFAGASTPESANYASFRAALEKIRNDSLRLNKGVQTEGDAQRAWNELFANLNDRQVVAQRLREIANLNERATHFYDRRIQNRRKTAKQEPLDVSDFYPDGSAYGDGQQLGGPPAAPVASQGNNGKDYSHLWGN